MNARRSIGKQLVEAIEGGAIRSAAQIERGTFHFGCGWQIGALLADFAERGRRFYHHHAAALGASQDLADGGRIAHLQPGFAGGASNSEKFHAACQRFGACPCARLVHSESFVGVVPVKAVRRFSPLANHKMSCYRYSVPFLRSVLTAGPPLITFPVGGFR